ncbi:MAG: group 1 truncated hemoglobin [Candidatus Rokubacteria bacterium]|nr:group 1 truncated hemoglobin [Candidatus Rokubacteria bacterium]MBI3827821.1 group 1 truncated hemoglobin [Candidatus Rokubacteria bacterium]
MNHLRMGYVLVVALVFAACSSMQGGQMAMEKKSLYDRLGGKPAITAVVDDFIGNVAADARINQRFAGANIPRLKTMLVDQICQASGGPCTYTGKSMLDAHRGMNVQDAEFNALVEDLVKSLDTLKVPAQEKSDLLGALGPLKPQIVGK